MTTKKKKTASNSSSKTASKNAGKRVSKQVSKPAKVKITAPKQGKVFNKVSKQISKKSLASAQQNIKQVKKQIQQRANATRKDTQNATKQLRQIERMLGEEFDNIKDALAALKRESTPVKKAATKPSKVKVTPTKASKVKEPAKLAESKPTPIFKGKQPKVEPLPSEPIKPLKLPISNRKSVFTVRDLMTEEKELLMDMAADRVKLKQLDKQLLKPGEYLGAEVPHKVLGKDGKVRIGYAKTRNLFSSFQSLMRKLADYAKHGKKLNAAGQQRFLASIKVVKFAGSGKEWEAKKQAEVTARKQYNAEAKQAQHRREQKQNRKG